MEGREYTEPTPKEKVEAALYHTRLMIEDKGEKIAIPESRKHVSWYLKGLRGNAPVRVEINHATTYDEIEKILNEIDLLYLFQKLGLLRYYKYM